MERAPLKFFCLPPYLLLPMEDESSNLPITKLPKRAFPPLKTNRNNGSSIMMELKKTLFSPTSLIRTQTFRTKRSMALVYSFTFIFTACTMVFLFGNSHIHQSSEWLKNMLKNRSQLPSYFPHSLFYDNGSKISDVSTLFPRKESALYAKLNDSHVSQNGSALASSESNSVNLNATFSSDFKKSSENHDSRNVALAGSLRNNSTVNPGIRSVKNETNDHGMQGNENESAGSNNTVLSKGENSRDGAKSMEKPKEKSWLEIMSQCDIFDGKWVKDDLPPLYEPGSCHHIDESFNCFQNGRPDNDYEKFRWQPNHCNIPRFNGGKMLKIFKGKRIVYVGDSLNRNMWESMVCLLMNSVKDKSRVFEASGRKEFKKEGAYSFLFPDYNFSVEYIRSAFLVQEWEMPVDNGSKKETLRLDLVEKSYDSYKDADVLVFNTGNWWTHEKTSEGKGYYQEGNHVHEKLDVVEAFDKAMATWARWVEANINPMKTHVFFRGYSFSHFSKGEWNSGGRCDSTEPIKDVKDLLSLDELHPPIPQMLDKSLERVKTPVFYLNVTRMTNYRRDGHPSMYRKPNMTEEEKRLFLTQQDCSHWCLPGVPDTWNELLFAQLFLSHKQRQWKQQSYSTRHVHL
ncbi:hypothetical protein Pfo_017713 [Paulownia fortunei]|nr:hypothetical protein Pfo_017713 [Paulownia fortunei]